MLLGWASQLLRRAPLARLFGETVAGAASAWSARASGRWRRARRRIAATELDGDQRLAPGLVWGEVHDGNAWALGGVAGHAGLFAPADDLGRFARALLAPERHPVLGPDSIAEMTRFQAGAPPDVRALGWRLDASEWGAWPSSTYWHTGFTGTSLLVAPELGLCGRAAHGRRPPRAPSRPAGRAARGGPPDPRSRRSRERAPIAATSADWRPSRSRPGARRPRPPPGRRARLADVRRRSAASRTRSAAAQAQIASAVDGVTAALAAGRAADLRRRRHGRADRHARRGRGRADLQRAPGPGDRRCSPGARARSRSRPRTPRTTATPAPGR